MLSKIIEQNYIYISNSLIFYWQNSLASQGLNNNNIYESFC